MARLWTPTQGTSGLLYLPPPQPLLAVVGAYVVEVPQATPNALGGLLQRVLSGGLTGSGHDIPYSEATEGSRDFTRRLRQVTLGGLVIVSSSRQKEPTRIVGHPDLASGASVQRGNTLYVSVTEAVYRESRGEEVEIHLHPDGNDYEALDDLRVRARHRWDNDRLPDGWTRPLPPPPATLKVSSKEASIEGLSDDLRSLAERFRAKADDRDE